MSTTTARSRLAAAREADPPSRWPWLAGVAVLLLLGLLAAWLAGAIRGPTDPRVAEILALQQRARERFVPTGGGSLSLADATAAATVMMEIRTKTEGLPERLREQVERNGSDIMRSSFRARIDRYFSLPPEQRAAEIDRQIDEEETWRKAFQAGRAVMNAVGGGQQGSAAPDSKASSSSSPQASWSGRSEEDRNRWRKGMIDRTTPEERARYTEWRRARDTRREQRGLPETWPR